MKKITIFLGALFLQITLFAQIPTDSLLLYLPFNGNTLDESGNGNNGINHNAILTEDRFGNINSAYYFDGNSSYIELPVSTFGSSTKGSFSFWVEIDSLPRNAIIHVGDSTLYIGNGNFYGIRIYEQDDTLPALIHIHDTRDCNGENRVGKSYFNTFQTSVWYHIVVTSDGSSTKFYINGVNLNLVPYNLLPEGRWINDLCSTINYFWLGKSKRVNDELYLNGKLDDIRIYSKILTEEEITALYNEGLCYETITVTDTLIINANLTSYNPVIYNNTIKIYPNPASDHIFIDVDDNSIGYEIRIINTLSQTVFETTLNQSQYNIDLNTWTGNGTYFVQFYNPDGNLIDVRKIIIQ